VDLHKVREGECAPNDGYILQALQYWTNAANVYVDRSADEVVLT